VNRESLIALANEAARDPSRAARIAGWIADELRDQAKLGETATPGGYLYAGSHEWIIKAQDLQVEPLPSPDQPNVGPITSSINSFIPLKTPFDALIVGMYGWAEPTPTAGADAPDELALVASLANAEDSRDLFSLAIGTDGQASFGTDGTDQLMFPASTVVGTRMHPRIGAWTVRRNQLIQARFRNITNVPLDGISSEVLNPIILKIAAVGFTVLNLGAP
jgi:hypothetical protein